MRFEFRVEGTLSEADRAQFADLRISQTPPQTILDGEVLDQSHLHGIIAQLQILGITVVSAHPVPECSEHTAATTRTAAEEDHD
jgi:hypothetical protein